MGYVMGFYSLDWSQLRNFLMTSSETTIASIRRVYWPDLISATEDSLRFNEALRTLRQLADPFQGHTISLEEDLISTGIIASLIEHLGIKLGSLDHASASGDDFRSEFLSAVAAPAFNRLTLEQDLTCRGLLRTARGSHPSWGGLTLEEVKALTLNPPDIPGTWHGEHAQWFDDLWHIFKEAIEMNKDLVTLYA